jgi:hypothetical protein
MGVNYVQKYNKEQDTILKAMLNYLAKKIVKQPLQPYSENIIMVYLVVSFVFLTFELKINNHGNQ